MPENSRQYSGETVDLGFCRVWVRGGRFHVETDRGSKPWLEKRGDTIYVVTDQKLDIEPVKGLN